MNKKRWLMKCIKLTSIYHKIIKYWKSMVHIIIFMIWRKIIIVIVLTHFIARIFTGKHYYKQMCLSALGYDVRNICYADYYDARGTSGRLKFLKRVLEWLLLLSYSFILWGILWISFSFLIQNTISTLTSHVVFGL